MIERLVGVLFLLSAVNGQEEALWNFELFKERVGAGSDRASSSDLCNRQLKELSVNNSNALWDLFDSSSKFPWSGLSTSTLMDWGNYDQCINTHHAYSEGKIEGKYCLAGLLIPTNLSTIKDADTIYKLAVCMPSGCTAKDYIEKFKIPLFNDAQCHTVSDLNNYTAGDYVMLVVCAGVIAIIAVSTTYDVYLYKKQKKTTRQLLIAFSAFTNGRKLLQTSKGNREQIQIFNGLKTISMAWIIAGHAMGGWNNVTVINRHIVEVYSTHLEVLYITTAQLAVDTFFYLSGFLVAYTYMKQKNKPLLHQIKSVPYMILHRIIRITPAVAMTFFFSITLYRHLGSGPIWHVGMEKMVGTCHKYWWSFFLYIQNYYNYKDVCLIQTWYLSADMQLYLISPIILIPMAVLLAKNPKNLKMVMIFLCLLNVLFIALPMTLKLIYTEYDNTFDSHSRLIDYNMGIMMGILVRETKDRPFFLEKTKRPSIMNLMIWCATMILLTVTAIFQQEITYNGYSHTAVAITHSLMRPAWCLGLSWIVYSSYHNYGGIINWILTRPTMQITSKLSYCMYLLHGLVVAHFVLITRTRIWFNDYIVFINWCGFFIMTLVVSTIWTLAFESPLIIIEKLIFGRVGKPSRQPKNVNTSKNIAADSNGENYTRKEKF